MRTEDGPDLARDVCRSPRRFTAHLAAVWITIADLDDLSSLQGRSQDGEPVNVTDLAQFGCSVSDWWIFAGTRISWPGPGPQRALAATPPLSACTAETSVGTAVGADRSCVDREAVAEYFVGHGLLLRPAELHQMPRRSRQVKPGGLARGKSSTQSWPIRRR